MRQASHHKPPAMITYVAYGFALLGHPGQATPPCDGRVTSLNKVRRSFHDFLQILLSSIHIVGLVEATKSHGSRKEVFRSEFHRQCTDYLDDRQKSFPPCHRILISDPRPPSNWLSCHAFTSSPTRPPAPRSVKSPPMIPRVAAPVSEMQS